ncbi:ferritin family protein [Clostridium lundense]|uniref:ferritin family protein n=1 Tax=Clostridium lundense TaxID=319475 RepID=UPI0012EBF6A3|nr:ferritin family protein [Clostridium lundense]
MIINDKNYEFNKEAFLYSNSLDNIRHCPFCGADSIYIKEISKGEENRVNLTIEELDEVTSVILDHAMKLEVFNGDFYKKASKLAKNEEIKKMFEALSNIEFMHAKIHKTLGGFKELPILKKMDYSKYEEDSILMDLANKREKHAVQYYNKYSQDVCSSKITEIFNILSDVEEDHIHLTLKK